MSVVQSGTDIGVSSLTPELTRASESTNSTITDQGSQVVDNAKQQTVNVIQQVQEQGASQKPLSPEQLEKVAQQLQDFVGEMNRGLEFSVDKDSGRDVIRVIDKSSGDLVKQFPSEEVLTLVAKLSEMVGGFVDAKV